MTQSNLPRPGVADRGLLPARPKEGLRPVLLNRLVVRRQQASSDLLATAWLMPPLHSDGAEVGPAVSDSAVAVRNRSSRRRQPRRGVQQITSKVG
jgi:hypothetical protein